jgi:hypothetical protein
MHAAKVASQQFSANRPTRSARLTLFVRELAHFVQHTRLSAHPVHQKLKLHRNNP